MPLRTLRNETDGTFAYTGSWNVLGSSGLWGTTPTTPALSGTVKYSGAAGAFLLITLPANHGFDAGVLLGHGASTNTSNATVTVTANGATKVFTWNMKFGGASSAYWMPRILSFPFKLNPANASPETIRVDVGLDGLSTVIDGMELYQRIAPTAGRLTSTGHSMEYGVTDSNTLGPQTLRHSKLMANHLGATNYLGVSAWTDDNQGVPSEDWCNGSASSGTAGGTTGAGALPQFVNQAMYPNIAIFTPGWMRAEAGDTWPNPAPNLPNTSLMGIYPGNPNSTAQSNANYMAGVNQWWARGFQYGIFWPLVNDLGHALLYDNPLPGAGGAANGAASLQQIQTCTPSGTIAGNLNFLWNGNTSILCSTANNVAGIQACLDGATPSPIPFTVSGAVGSPLATGGAGVTFTNKSYGATVANITNNYAGTGAETMATTQAGRNATPAGVGYSAARHKQRVREALIRVACAITPCPRVAILGYPNSQNGVPLAAGVVSALAESYEQGIRDILLEPWIADLTGGAPFFFVPLLSQMTGTRLGATPTNVNIDAGAGAVTDGHPGPLGHQYIFEAIRREHERTLPTAYNLGGSNRT